MSKDGSCVFLIRTFNCSWFGFQTGRSPAIFYPLDYLHNYLACHFLEFLPDLLIAFFCFLSAFSTSDLCKEMLLKFIWPSLFSLLSLTLWPGRYIFNSLTDFCYCWSLSYNFSWLILKAGVPDFPSGFFADGL